VLKLEQKVFAALTLEGIRHLVFFRQGSRVSVGRLGWRFEGSPFFFLGRKPKQDFSMPVAGNAMFSSW
jgi:hypothetical protein